MHTYSSCMVLNSLVDVREDVARCRNWLVVYVLVFRSEPVDEPGFSLARLCHRTILGSALSFVFHVPTIDYVPFGMARCARRIRDVKILQNLHGS